MTEILNFIDGSWHKPIKGEWMTSENPATAEVNLKLPASDIHDVNLAVDAATAAFPLWSKLTVQERAKYLYKIADLIDERADELALVESLDQGKPVWLAREMDIARAAYNFRFFAGAALHQTDMATQMDQGSFNYVVREPIGVAGLISPWNLPLYLLTWKIAPAIAFGNTCVAKPSEFTSHTAYILTEIFNKVGLPKGVVNIIFGRGATAGAALVDHPKVPVISFTGGTATGKAIATAAAAKLKKVSLELGGKNPTIVFDDADLERAVATTVRASFLNQGEICLCGSRIYVQEKVFDKFLSMLKEKTDALVVGDPLDKDSYIGALVSKEHFEKVTGFLKYAETSGAKFVSGSARSGGVSLKLSEKYAKGYFVRPTILTGVPQDSKLVQEEIFGPVVTVLPFKDEAHAIELANGVSYGLSASVLTENLGRAHRVAAKLKVGTVWINAWMKRDLRIPFGGMKASGIGREGQDASLDFFTESKTICVQHTDPPPSGAAK